MMDQATREGLVARFRDYLEGVEETPERLICRLQPELLVKGGDNEPDKIPGARCVRESGGQVLVMSYVDNCSTTGIIHDIRQTTSRS
jgi:D-beta-D-heptose 7-phosphate kinase/D-beta-D-heptose 1-phosphate adenosyltransferase